MINDVKNYYCGENKLGYVIWKDLDTLKKDAKFEDGLSKIWRIQK